MMSGYTRESRKHAAQQVTKIFHVLLIGLSLVFSLSLQVSAETEETSSTPLAFGIYPYAPATLVAQHFEPIREHLEASLARPIELMFFPSYKHLLDAAERGEFALAYVPLFLAALMTEEFGYSTSAVISRPLSLRLYVRSDSSIDQIAMLRGKRVGVVDPLAETSILTVEYFEQNGLILGRDVEVLHHCYHSDALMSVFDRRVDAVSTNPEAVALLEPTLRSELRQLALINEGTAAGEVLVHRDIEPAIGKRLRETLISYVAVKNTSFLRKGEAPFNDAMTVDNTTRARMAKRMRKALDQLDRDGSSMPHSH